MRRIDREVPHAGKRIPEQTEACLAQTTRRASGSKEVGRARSAPPDRRKARHVMEWDFRPRQDAGQILRAMHAMIVDHRRHGERLRSPVPVAACSRSAIGRRVRCTAREAPAGWGHRSDSTTNTASAPAASKCAIAFSMVFAPKDGRLEQYVATGLQAGNHRLPEPGLARFAQSGHERLVEFERQRQESDLGTQSSRS